ncbi:MAG: hypothetical protein D6788_01895 [Planctomycetota bacterium]|nr:MAG: hypothetical protein D6788_01895 [Planctomycetota bacterium]
MALDEEARRRIEAFRAEVEASVARDGRYGAGRRFDREDASTLATRFAAGDHCWFEVAVRPFVPQVRVAILTDDRWKSEEMEQAIQDSGDTMSEFVGLGFEDAGLDWPEPPVEHYREGGTYFYFATPLDLEAISDLDRPDVRNRVLRMLEGYRLAFGPTLTAQEE